jgi:hypothetical protein
VTRTVSLDQVERQWALANPGGEAEQSPNGALALWNFGVGGTELRPEHEAALRGFIGTRLMARTRTSFVVSGYASQTGSEPANEALAEGRARAVARWLDNLGFVETTVAQNPGAQPVTGEDGRALARSRRVEILSYDPYPPAAPPEDAPEFVWDRIAEPARPVPSPPRALPQAAVSAEDPPPDWIPKRFATGLTLPDQEIGRIDNPWVKAKIRVEGAFRVVGGDRSATAVQVMAKEMNRAEVSVTRALTDWLSARVVYETPNPTKEDGRPNVRAGLVASGRSETLRATGEVELSVQPQRFPNEFVYLSFGITPYVPVTVFGEQITLLATLKLKVTGGPGPATLRLAARVGAAAVSEVAAAAAPYAFPAAVVTLTAAFIVAAAYGVEEVRQEGLRHTQRISGRDAFAARIAFEVAGPSSRGELEALMNEWRNFLDPEVGATAARCYRDADTQVDALRTAGRLDLYRTMWTTKYAQRDGQPDPSFHGVRMRMFDVLGGYAKDGPISFGFDTLGVVEPTP